MKSSRLLIILFNLILLQYSKVIAQTDSVTIDSKVFEKVEIEAYFPGGDNAWLDFISKNLAPNTPVENGAPAGTYTVVIQFIVDKEGNLSDIKPLTHHGYGMESEVMRVLRKSPKWMPAVQEGRKVKAYRKQPVTFQVIEEKRRGRKNRTNN